MREARPRQRERSVDAVARLALTANEPAAALGVSRDFFDEHIAPELRCVRRGRMKLYPIAELQRWLEREAALTLDDRRREKC